MSPTSRSNRTRRRPAFDLVDSRARQLVPVIAFGLVLAMLFGLGATGAVWYAAHLAPVARVDGVTITRDRFTARVAIERFELGVRAARLRTAINLGHVEGQAGETQLTALQTARQAAGGPAYESAIDTELLLAAAAREGLVLTEADISSRLATHATTPETRAVAWLAVRPVSLGATGPTAAAQQLAAQQANSALVSLRIGKAWLDVIRGPGVATNKPTTTAGVPGDVGWIVAGDAGVDAAFSTALFALPKPGFTEVIKGVDGVLRIGWVRDIVPAELNVTYVDQLQAAGISLDEYRHVLAGEVARQKLSDLLIAREVTAPSPMVHLAEILVAADTKAANTANEARVRHILIAPNHDPAKASTVPPTDPAWTVARDRALALAATFAAVRVDPVKFEAAFAALAQADSQDPGSSSAGGDLGWVAINSNYDTGFRDPIFAAPHKVGDLVGPVRSAYGWHLILITGARPGAATRAQQLRDEAARPATDFAALAKANSAAPDAASGGDMGWIARDQLSLDQDQMVFGLSAGGVSVVYADSTGYRFFKALEIKARLPDATQAASLRAVLLDHWFVRLKADPNTRIDRITIPPVPPLNP